MSKREIVTVKRRVAASSPAAPAGTTSTSTGTPSTAVNKKNPVPGGGGGGGSGGGGGGGRLVGFNTDGTPRYDSAAATASAARAPPPLPPIIAPLLGRKPKVVAVLRSIFAITDLVTVIESYCDRELCVLLLSGSFVHCYDISVATSATNGTGTGTGNDEVSTGGSSQTKFDRKEETRRVLEFRPFRSFHTGLPRIECALQLPAPDNRLVVGGKGAAIPVYDTTALVNNVTGTGFDTDTDTDGKSPPAPSTSPAESVGSVMADHTLYMPAGQFHLYSQEEIDRTSYFFGKKTAQSDGKRSAVAGGGSGRSGTGTGGDSTGTGTPFSFTTGTGSGSGGSGGGGGGGGSDSSDIAFHNSLDGRELVSTTFAGVNGVRFEGAFVAQPRIVSAMFVVADPARIQKLAGTTIIGVCDRNDSDTIALHIPPPVQSLLPTTAARSNKKSGLAAVADTTPFDSSKSQWGVMTGVRDPLTDAPIEAHLPAHGRVLSPTRAVSTLALIGGMACRSLPCGVDWNGYDWAERHRIASQLRGLTGLIPTTSDGGGGGGAGLSGVSRDPNYQQRVFVLTTQSTGAIQAYMPPVPPSGASGTGSPTDSEWSLTTISCSLVEANSLAAATGSCACIAYVDGAPYIAVERIPSNYSWSASSHSWLVRDENAGSGSGTHPLNLLFLLDFDERSIAPSVVYVGRDNYMAVPEGSDQHKKLVADPPFRTALVSCAAPIVISG